jgi:hypothetical protein
MIIPPFIHESRPSSPSSIRAVCSEAKYQMLLSFADNFEEK